MTPETDPREFVIKLRAEKGRWRTAPLQRLRAALKALLRGYGFRCLTVTPVETDKTQSP